MAIDDPVGTVIQQAKEDKEAESYLPDRLARLGLSAAVAAAFAHMPFVAQILTSLLSNSPARFEEHFLQVATELHAQQKRIEDRISDMNYYESEEFHSLLTLILERLHATHQKEKLKMFGDALANSGSSDFKGDDTEQYIRTLRDLSLEDLQLLKAIWAAKKLPEPYRNLSFKESAKPSVARLVGFGLISEVHGLKKFNLTVPVTPTSSQSPERYARGLADAFSKYFEQAPFTTRRISDFGERFLDFISADESGDMASNS
ncbi:hypothetical protein [Acidicapsa ligni]|uniref:hypothetical protein n=1 Tax=Acidicapsa ligni TaxID=542300 RepID=UPI0021E0C8E2|nr:hypothetical protein [Acidicapsa ligni]